MNCGDPTIDGLLAGEASIQPLSPGADGRAVGYLQELLRGHGYHALPDARGPSYGIYGPATRLAVTDYRRRNSLAPGEQADSPLIGDLVRRPASHAVLGPAYVPLALNVPFAPVIRFVWLTSLFETGGRLGTLDLNSDQCGVSFGHPAMVAKTGPTARHPAGLLHAGTRGMGTRIWGRHWGPAFSIIRRDRTAAWMRAAIPSIPISNSRKTLEVQARSLGASPAMQRIQLDLASDVYRRAETNSLRSCSAPTSNRSAASLFFWIWQISLAPGRVAQQYKAAASRERRSPKS